MSRGRGRPPGGDGETTRQAILDAVRANPGINRTRLCETVGYEWGTVGHHLSVLEKRGLVASERMGRTRAYFRNEIPTEHFAALALLSEPRQGEILGMISETPGINADQLSRQSPWSRRIVTRVLQRLEETGLVMQRDRGLLPGPSSHRIQALKDRQERQSSFDGPGLEPRHR